MAFFLFPFFFLSTSSFMHLTHIPPLLSLSCVPSPRNFDPIEPLLSNLTFETPDSLYTTFRRGQYTGLAQCRPGCSLGNCILCIEEARITILNLCRHSDGVSAWFDGCYVQISSSDFSNTSISNHFCSGRVHAQDPSVFAPALASLLLKLRADVSIPTHCGFSHGEIVFRNSDRGESRIYGLVECARSLSPRECDSCVAKAADELLSYCGGENGGVLVHGMCLVRFDSSNFYVEDVNTGVEEVRGEYFSEGEGENGRSEKTTVIVYWSGGVGCFALVVLMAWLLRRAVLNRGKVGISDFAGFEQTALANFQ